MSTKDEAWIVWDKTVPAVMQRGPIGSEDTVREHVRKQEFWRKQQPSCTHEIDIRYEARRLIVEQPE